MIAPVDENGSEKTREGICIDLIRNSLQKMKVIWTRVMAVEKTECIRKEIGGVKLTKTWL